MPRHRFRLETLMKLRLASRDTAREQFAEAQQAKDRLDAQQRDLDHRRSELARTAGQTAGAGPVDVDRLIEISRYSAVLSAEERQLKQFHATIDQELDRRRGVLVEADREVKVLEKLKEREGSRMARQQRRREIKQLDEAAARTRRAQEQVT